MNAKIKMQIPHGVEEDFFEIAITDQKSPMNSPQLPSDEYRFNKVSLKKLEECLEIFIELFNSLILNSLHILLDFFHNQLDSLFISNNVFFFSFH